MRGYISVYLAQVRLAKELAMARSSEVSILLVEDDEIDVRAVKLALRKEKITNPIHVANDGVEALEILRGEAGHEPISRPFLVLLDLKMPRMNGLQFLKEIRADSDLRESIVFVLTTSDDDRDKMAAYECNVAGYLLKDNAGGDFMNAVRMLEYFVISVQFPPNLDS